MAAAQRETAQFGGTAPGSGPSLRDAFGDEHPPFVKTLEGCLDQLVRAMMEFFGEALLQKQTIAFWRLVEDKTDDAKPWPVRIS